MNFNTILQIDFYCKKEGKCNEVPHVLAFMALYQNPRLKGQCKVSVAHIPKSTVGPELKLTLTFGVIWGDLKILLSRYCTIEEGIK